MPLQALESSRCVAANEDRRIRFLNWFGPGLDAVEIDELALVTGFILGPDRLHGLDPFPRHLPAPRPRDTMIFQLLLVPAPADTKINPPARDMIQAGDLLGGNNRVPFGDQADTGAQADVFGHRRRRRQAQEHIHVVGIIRRQVTTKGEAGAAAGRNMGVIGHEQGVQAAFFHRHSQVRRLHGIVRWEHADAEIHNHLHTLLTQAMP